MTNFENLKKMSIEDLAVWLDKYGMFDSSPWSEFFNREYCEKCEAVECHYEDAKKIGLTPFYDDTIECAYCEVYGKCKFFHELDNIPDNRAVIKLWLEEAADENM